MLVTAPQPTATTPVPPAAPAPPGLPARTARNGTLVLGGGFGGAHVARSLGKAGATIVSPESSLLYTPLLPEVAAGAIEPRHVYVPLRMMCPHAEHLRGRAVAVDEVAKTVTVETELGPVQVRYERLVVALGSTARMLPVPGLAEHAIPFKGLGDAIHLRNHVLRRLDLAESDPANADRYLTFVFVGAGYAGVEACAELFQLVHETRRHYPALRDLPQRWVLVNSGPKILAEVPERLGAYAAKQLARRGVELRLNSKVVAAEPGAVRLSDGSRIRTDTLVWTAGVVPNPAVAGLGLPLDGSGRIVVDDTLRVQGRDDVWALGDSAAVPNAATPTRTDPPTCQHALRQARHVAKSLSGSVATYRFTSIGEGATLGRDKGIARVFGIQLRGMLAATIIRWYHLRQVPLMSRRLRILADGTISALFRRDIAELGTIEPRRADA